jgi:hypothetical protein
MSNVVGVFSTSAPAIRMTEIGMMLFVFQLEFVILLLLERFVVNSALSLLGFCSIACRKLRHPLVDSSQIFLDVGGL